MGAGCGTIATPNAIWQKPRGGSSQPYNWTSKMSGGHNPAYVERHQETPTEVKKREARNKARYQLEKRGIVHKGDGKDVDHRQPLAEGGSNSPSNWRVRSRHANRAEGDLDAKHRPL